MGFTLTGDQFRAALRKIGEIERQLGQEEYPFDPERFLDALQALTEGRFEAEKAGLLTFRYDKTKDGWELVENVGMNPAITSIGDLRPVSFLKSGETSTGGEEMVRWSRGELKANLGQQHAEWLLEHQSEIPESWRQYELVFIGTLWRDSGGYRCVACLSWVGDQWYLNFVWLDDSFYRFRGNYRVLRFGE